MTVITKPKTILKKLQLQREANSRESEDNTVVYFEDEEKVELQVQRTRSLLYSLLQVLLLLGLVALLALLIYFQCFRMATIHRYQGFCTIPVPLDTKQLMQSNYRMEPLRWSASPDLQLISTLDEATSDELVNYLREHLDIGDMVEKISVYDNGRQINFIHDFNDNVTGIVDVERCFMMDLDPDWVLSPAQLAGSMQRGDARGLDTSLLRGVWRALLPPASAGGRFSGACDFKPVYQLQREDVVIRKRSADEPSHEYLQFAGKHVAAIAIDNMAELRDYEEKHKNNN